MSGLQGLKRLQRSFSLNAAERATGAGMTRHSTLMQCGSHEELREPRTKVVLPLAHTPARQSLRLPQGLLVRDWCESLWQQQTSSMQEGEGVGRA